MKFTANRKALVAALSEAQGVLNTKIDLPYLRGVRIEALDGDVTVSASDLQVFLDTSISADVDDKGEPFIINPVPALAFLNLVDEEEVSVEVDAGSVKFSCKASPMKFGTCPRQTTDSWPVLDPDETDEDPVTLSEIDARVIKLATSIAGDKEGRLLMGSSGDIWISASDRRKGFIYGQRPDITSTVPANSLRRMGPVAGSRLRIGKRRIHVQTGSSIYSANLGSEKVVDATAIIGPLVKETEPYVEVLGEELLRVAGALSKLGTASVPPVVHVKLAGEHLHFESIDPSGTLKTSIPAIAKKGTGWSVCIDPKHLFDMIAGHPEAIFLRLAKDIPMMKLYDGTVDAVVSPIRGAQAEKPSSGDASHSGPSSGEPEVSPGEPP